MRVDKRMQGVVDGWGLQLNSCKYMIDDTKIDHIGMICN